ncbi:TetR/AcrR family transcriptional regulator [Undibacterium arcticum]|uniref:TetR/AcrR family transcriptional regulator n=1 Tax=Undibacterium arcticum TaxID=1762892 RepID=UPI003613E048
MSNSIYFDDTVVVITGVDSGTPGCKAAGRPRAADMEARARNLLETAECLFLEKGYSKVSLKMIAREAHVAVRTIYVKFSGKAGLFNAVLAAGRSRYFNIGDMGTDMRPLEQILSDFGLRYLRLVSMPKIVSLRRMVIAEAHTNPEMAITYNQAGPGQTKKFLIRFFERADIKINFQDDIPADTLAIHFLNCIQGDPEYSLLFEKKIEPTDTELQHKVTLGLNLFNGTVR